MFIRELLLIFVGLIIALLLLLQLSDDDVQVVVRIPLNTISTTNISRELLASENTITTPNLIAGTNTSTGTQVLHANYPIVGGTEDLYEVVNGSTFHHDIPFKLFMGYANGKDLQLPLCPGISPNLVGLSSVNEDILSLPVLIKQHKELQSGGRWQPSYCSARHRVAIIVPYRNRPDQLKVFLKHMHPFLQRQQLDYAIIVVEQTNSSSFNRAMLMNIGATHAAELYDSQCYVLHDVDLLPEDDRTLYACPKQPLHMSAAIKNYNYTLIYDGNFGGVVSINRKQFELINGLSNLFFGWGGEDDDFYNRVTTNYLTPERYTESLARYTMIAHKSEEKSEDRVPLVITGQMRYNIDGLNSLVYKTLKMEKLPLYTRILVDINQDDVMETVPKMFRELPTTVPSPTDSLLPVGVTDKQAPPVDNYEMTELTQFGTIDSNEQQATPVTSTKESPPPLSNDWPVDGELILSNDSIVDATLPLNNHSPVDAAQTLSNDLLVEAASPLSNDSLVDTAPPRSSYYFAHTVPPLSNVSLVESTPYLSNNPPVDTAAFSSNDLSVDAPPPLSSDSLADETPALSSDPLEEADLPLSSDLNVDDAPSLSNNLLEYATQLVNISDVKLASHVRRNEMDLT